MSEITKDAIGRFFNTTLALFLTFMLVGAFIPQAAFGTDDQTPGIEENGGDPGGSGGEGDGSGGAGQGGQTDKIYVTELYLRWSADYNGANAFVGPNGDLQQIDITKKGQLVQLNGYYLDSSGSGVLQETANSATQLGSIRLNWTSSDASVATVDPNGLVTPRGNGTAYITAEIADPATFGAASITVPIVIDGQEGEYVQSVDIVDVAGNSIVDTVVIETEADTTQYYQLYAKVTWADADGNFVREETTETGVSSTVRWASVGNASVLYVNESTGRVATQEPGVGQIEVRVDGGVGGQVITDTVAFRVTTGQASSGQPAQSLTINIYHQSFPDTPVATREFSLDELASTLPTATYNYTIINGSTFGTIRATGYMFKDILALANYDLEDTISFSFGTADGYQNQISYGSLFSTRYYFPNYDIGSMAEAQIVAPILATSAYVRFGASVVLPDQALDSDIRFRLCFGATGPGDANTSLQVHSIHTINITVKDSSAVPGGSGGAGGAGGEGVQGGGAAGEIGAGAGQGSYFAGESGTTSGEASSESTDEEAAAASGADEQDASAAGASGADSGQQWRIYQVMQMDSFVRDDLDLDNPLSPFALPAACAAVAGGAISSIIGFRRRLYS